MNEIVKKVKGIRIELIMVAIFITVLGIVMMAFPLQSQILICRGAGIVFCIWGVIKMIQYFRIFQEKVLGSFGLVQGVAMISFGIYFIVKPEVLVEIFGTVIAIVILVDAILKIQYAMDLHKMNVRHWWIDLIGAFVMLILGIIAVCNPFTSADILMIFAGATLTVEGIWDLIAVIRISIIAKKVRKAAKDALVEVVDADVVE